MHGSQDLEQDPQNFRSIIYRDPTVNDPMEFTTDNSCTMLATRSDMSTALSDPEHFLAWAILDIGAKMPSFKTTLLEPCVATNEETRRPCGL